MGLLGILVESFYLTLVSMAPKTKSPEPLPLPPASPERVASSESEGHASRCTKKAKLEGKHVHNVEMSVVTVFLINSSGTPVCQVDVIAIPFAEPPVAPNMCEGQRTTEYSESSEKWRETGWRCTLRTTLRDGSVFTTEEWRHHNYLETFSLNDMQNARYKLERENQYFAHKRYVVQPDDRGRDALFCFNGLGKTYTRAQVHAHIKVG